MLLNSVICRRKHTSNTAYQTRKTTRRSSAAMCLATLLASLLSPLASADRIVMDFEGFDTFEGVFDYYDGGTGHLGSGPGPDWGIEFDLAVSITNATITNLPSGSAGMSFDARVGNPMTMNVQGGFSGPVTFEYSSENIEVEVRSYSGLNGTGSVLDSLLLNPQYVSGSSEPDTVFEIWQAVALSFSGVAQSLVFEATGSLQPGGIFDSRGGIVMDNLSVVIDPTTTVPLAPTWSLLLLAMAILAGRSKRDTFNS